MTESAIGTEDVPRCPLCGSEERKLLYAGLEDRLFGASGEWSIKQCNRCGSVFLDPRPTEQDIHKAYRTYYTHEEGVVAVHRSIFWSVSKKVFYFLDSVARQASSLTQEYERIQSMYLDRRSAGRLLDVGCGQGRFLDYMRRRDWVVEGVETDPEAAEIARSQYGVSIWVGDLQSANYPDGCFDAVTMNHVIEHVHNPVGLLRECHRVLKAGGVLVAVTPNVESWGHRRFMRHWLGLDPPRHLQIFSLETLKDCARHARYGTINAWTTPANADVVFAGSLGIRSSGKYDMSGKPPVRHALFAKLLQHWEATLTKFCPEIGEEAVLWLEK